jgi:hypothetical protein
MKTLIELQKRALEVRQKYNDLNLKDGHSVWGAKDYAMGFVGDVSDLQKIIMAKEKMRRMDDIDSKLSHELADCFWSILVIAEHYEIDLEASFLKTMDDLDVRIGQDL